MKLGKASVLVIAALVIVTLCGCSSGSLQSASSTSESPSNASTQTEPSGPVDGYVYVVSIHGESQAVGFHEEAAAQEDAIDYRGNDYELVGTVTFYDDSLDPRDYANQFAGRLMHGEILLFQVQRDGTTVFNRYEKRMSKVQKEER